MLYRYMGSPAVSGSLDRFPDRGAVGGDAEEAMCWAVETGLVNGTGKGDTLSPKATATRAELAALVLRAASLFASAEA